MSRRLIAPDGALKDRPYLDVYEQLFAPLADEPVRLLELGVHQGGSMVLWRDYFPRGVIAGLDAEAVAFDDDSGRVRIYQGLQQDTAILDRIAAEVAPGGFDIIIDDAAHIGHFARASFWHLFPNHLKPGGIYAIEDWGTGYWESWHDGAFCPPEPPAGRLAEPYRDSFPSHASGMVGFVKELVDEAGMLSRTNPDGGIPPRRQPLIRELRFFPGQVIAFKAGPEAS